METISTVRSFGGVQGVYRHASAATGTPMTFGVYVPPQARERFAVVPQAEVVGVDGAKHLFVGYTETVLDEVVRRVAPDAFPLPRTYEETA